MNSKIYSRSALAGKLKACRKKRRRIVFTNGCFDFLHLGHVRLLEAARRLGDVLVVAVNSDASVRKLKGSGRPIHPASVRTQVLAALGCVDYVTVFSEETPEKTIESLKPDILVKGGDYSLRGILGRHLVKRVVRIPMVPGFSTTRLIQRLKKI